MRTMLLPTTARVRKPGAVTKPSTPAPPSASTQIAFAWPSTSDAVLKSIRPTQPAILQCVVDPAGNGTHTTIQAALNAIASKQQIMMALKNTSSTDPTMRGDVMVVTPPLGIYSEMITNLPPHVAVFAQTPDKPPTLQNTAHDAPAGGVIAPHNSCYWESVNVTCVPNDFNTGKPSGAAGGLAWDPKYPNHQGCKGTLIYANCTFSNIATQSGGFGFVAGSDGDNNGFTLFYNFVGLDGGLNFHGAPTNTGGETICVVNSVIHNDPTKNTGAQFCGWDDLGAGTSDAIWINNSTIDGQFQLTQGKNVTVNIDSASKIGTLTNKVTGGIPFGTSTSWPVPTGGMSAWEKSHYGLTA